MYSIYGLQGNKELGLKHVVKITHASSTAPLWSIVYEDPVLPRFSPYSFSGILRDLLSDQSVDVSY